MDPELTQNITDLHKEIEDFAGHYQKLHRLDFRGHHGTFVLGIGCSLGAGIAGLADYSKLAAVLGFVLTGLFSAQNELRLREKGEFYRLIVAYSKNLMCDLRYTVRNESDFKNVLDRFKELREQAAALLPKGQTMESLKKLEAELKKRNPSA